MDSGAEKISFTKVLCSTKAIITSLAIVVSTFSWSILDPTLEPHLRKVGFILFTFGSAHEIFAYLVMFHDFCRLLIFFKLNF